MAVVPEPLVLVYVNPTFIVEELTYSTAYLPSVLKDWPLDVPLYCMVIAENVVSIGTTSTIVLPEQTTLDVVPVDVAVEVVEVVEVEEVLKDALVLVVSVVSVELEDATTEDEEDVVPPMEPPVAVCKDVVAEEADEVATEEDGSEADEELVVEVIDSLDAVLEVVPLEPVADKAK